MRLVQVRNALDRTAQKFEGLDCNGPSETGQAQGASEAGPLASISSAVQLWLFVCVLPCRS